MWSESALRTFARDGYLLVRGVIRPRVQAAALARIDALLAERPPPPDHTGHRFYFEDSRTEPELLGLLVDTPAWPLAEALTHHASCRPTSGADRTHVPAA